MRPGKKTYIRRIVIASAVLALDVVFCLTAGVFSRDGSGKSQQEAEYNAENMPEGLDLSNMPQGFDRDSLPEGFDASNMPQGFDRDSLPEGFDPSNMPGGFSSEDLPQNFDTEETAAEQKETILQSLWVRIAAAAVFFLCLLTDLVSIVGLSRWKKREDQTEEAAGPENDPVRQEPVDPLVLRQQRKRRQVIGYSAVLALILIAAVVLQSLSKSAKQASGMTVEEQVVTDTVEKGTISKTLNSYGTIASASEEDINLPGNILVTKYHVAEGDAVNAGDKLATVDRSSVLAAIGELEELIEELDEEAEDLLEESVSSSLTASAGGTVVRIYAESEDNVVDVMYENGALMLLSLDGLLAVQIENTGDLGVGDKVAVIGNDKEEAEGRVTDIEKENITVTVSLEDLDYDENVTVRDSSGKELGSGVLYIYSQQKITGYSGTVSSVSVSEGTEVDSGDTLLKLSDTGYRPDYQTLLNKRKKLVDQYNQLVEVSRTGFVYAEEDGVISGLNEDLVVSITAEASASGAASLNTKMYAPASVAGKFIKNNIFLSEETAAPAGEDPGSSADTGDAGTGSGQEDPENGGQENPESGGGQEDPESGGGQEDPESGSGQENPENGGQEDPESGGGQEDPESGGGSEEPENGSEQENPEDADGPDQTEKETVTKTVNIVWMTADEAVPDSLTVVLLADGKPAGEKQVTEKDDWSVSFTDLPKAGDDGKEIGYTVELKKESVPENCTATVKNNGDVFSLIVKSGDEGTEKGGEMPEGTEPAEPAEPSGDFGGKTPAKGGSGMSMPSMGGGSGMKVNMSALNSSGLLTTEGATLESVVQETDNTYTYKETTLGTLTPNDTVSVEISIDEMDIMSIVIGSEVRVTLDAFPGQSFKGKITSLDPFGTNSGGNTKYTVTVSMDKQEDMLIGMNASVQIVFDEYTDILMIPEAALVEKNGSCFVYTVYDEETEELGGLTEVTVGSADGTNAEILSGLEIGQTIYYRYAGTISYVFVSTDEQDEEQTEEEA